MTITDSRKAMFESVSEKDFLASVMALAKARCWKPYHTHDSRRSGHGFPDLVLARSTPTDQRIIVAELKRQHGQVMPAQREWLTTLGLVADECDRHVEVHLWRPSQMPEIERRLR